MNLYLLKCGHVASDLARLKVGEQLLCWRCKTEQEVIVAHVKYDSKEEEQDDQETGDVDS